MKTVFVIEWSNGNTDVFKDRKEARSYYEGEELCAAAMELGEVRDINDCDGPSYCTSWSSRALEIKR